VLSADDVQGLDILVNNLAAKLKEANMTEVAHKKFRDFKASLRGDRLAVFRAWGREQYPSDGSRAHDADGTKYAREIRIAPVW
jgi:hypothetical protein